MSRLSQSFTARCTRLAVTCALAGIALGAARALPAAAAATATPGYALTILSTLGPPATDAIGINDRGWIVGAADLPGNATAHATLWRNGVITDLGTLGGANSGARPNNSGLITGAAETSKVDPLNEGWGTFLSCPPGTGGLCDGWQNQTLAFVWKNGRIRPLPTLGGNNALEYAGANANNRGEIAGFAETATKDPSCAPPQVLDWEAVVWGPGNGEIRELPPWRGDRVGAAIGINDNGQAVGGSGSCVQPSSAANIGHALLWQHGVATDLGNLGGAMNNIALSINNRGQVVGLSDLLGDMTAHAFLWERGMMTDLGTLPGDVFSQPFSINDAGQVVGQSCPAIGNCRAFLWQDGTMTDLNAITDVRALGASGYLSFAESINSHGEIVGGAVDQSGDPLGYSAVPCDIVHFANQSCDKRRQDAASTYRASARGPQSASAQLHRPLGIVGFGRWPIALQ